MLEKKRQIISVGLLLVSTLLMVLSSAEAKVKRNVADGDLAPDFTLPDQDGNQVSLSQFRDKKIVVLFFYPKDDSKVCTKEACNIRDNLQNFTDDGAEVLGISTGSAKSHKQFIERNKLTYRLLVDDGGKVRKAFDVPRATFGLFAGRGTFVIDKDGLVRLTASGLMHEKRQVRQALQTVSDISPKATAAARVWP